MSIDDEAESLKAIPMFADIEPARLKLIAFTSARLDFAQDEVVFRQGGPADGAYVVLSGSVNVEIEMGGRRVPVARHGRHALIGEMGLLTGAPRSATIIAAEPLSVLKIESDVFADLLREFPGLSLAVMRDLATRLRATTQALAEKSLA